MLFNSLDKTIAQERNFTGNLLLANYFRERNFDEENKCILALLNHLKNFDMTILKNILLALALIGSIFLLSKTFLPDNALRIGTGFHRHTPALSYPMRIVFLSALVYIVLSFFIEGRKLWITYAIILLGNLAYLIYCLNTYVET